MLNSETTPSYPAQNTTINVDFEPAEGPAEAEDKHAKSKRVLQGLRPRRKRLVRRADPCTIDLIMELRQINTHLTRMTAQQRSQQSEQAKTLRNTRASISCVPVTTSELSSGSRLLHTEWYSEFSSRSMRDLKFYFLAISGGDWNPDASVNSDFHAFNCGRDPIQVDRRLELISLDYDSPHDGRNFKTRSLGAWDQRALPEAESIAMYYSSDHPRDDGVEWRTRRNLGTLRSIVNAHWFVKLVISRGRAFTLYIGDGSFKNCCLDTLVFLAADTPFPALRRLGGPPYMYAQDEEGNCDHNCYSYEPDDDPRPIIGHIW